MASDEVLNIYNEIMAFQPSSLSFVQIIKLHAILNQEIYELPILKLKIWNKAYVRIYEFYDRLYAIEYNVYICVRDEFVERECLYGSKIFENISSEDNSIQLSNLFHLIETRKFTQQEFEKCCMKNIWRLNDVEKTLFIRSALAVNYNIPTVHRDIYTVALMLKYPELATKLTRNNIGDPSCISRLLMLGYKIKGKEFVIILTDGVKIKTNKINDNNDRINKEKENKRYLIAEQLYFNMSKERKIDYIDLRFNDYIIKYLGDSK